MTSPKKLHMNTKHQLVLFIFLKYLRFCFIISENAAFPFPSIAQIIQCNLLHCYSMTFSCALSFLWISNCISLSLLLLSFLIHHLLLISNILFFRVPNNQIIMYMPLFKDILRGSSDLHYNLDCLIFGLLISC